MELFHLTNAFLIPQILQEGLQPELRERSRQCEKEEAIFLFTSMEALDDAVLNWFADEVSEEVPLGVLKDTIPESIDPNVGYEAVCKVPIPPELIQEYYTEIEF